jgi:hypothetical protein
MATIPMRALVPFVLEGRAIAPGEAIQVAAPTAAMLRYQRKADFLTMPVVVDPEPARPKRTYKRRDLHAES